MGTQEIEFAGGRVTSSPVPDFHLIPTVCLRLTSERFRLGIERKGSKSWNALSANQEVLTDIPFLIERTSHIIDHALKLRDKLLTYRDDPAAGLTALTADDDASAIVWGGMMLQCAGESLKAAQDARCCVPSEKMTEGSGEATEASQWASEAFSTPGFSWVTPAAAARECGVSRKLIFDAVVERKVRATHDETGQQIVCLDDVWALAEKAETKEPADPDAEVEAAAGCDGVPEDWWITPLSAAALLDLSEDGVRRIVTCQGIGFKQIDGRLHVRLSDVRRLAERLRGNS